MTHNETAMTHDRFLGAFLLRLVILTAPVTVACTPDTTTQPSTDAAVTTANAVTYTVRDLGTLGGTNSVATDINHAGVVVGSSATAAGTTHAFRWRNGVMTDLGTLAGGSNSGAAAINNDGIIVGFSQNSLGRDRAVRWGPGGNIKSLLTLGGLHSRATAINRSGWIVGWSLTSSGEVHAFLWRNGVMTDLGTLGGKESVATGISASGAVVGYSTKTGVLFTHPFRWKDGVMRELPTLGCGFTRALAINGGVVVGHGGPEGDACGDLEHALIWKGGVLTDLGRLDGGDFVHANDVNSEGVVVGHIDHNPPDCRHEKAFVWNQGVLTLLPEIGGENTIAGANGINQAGLVVGFSETDTGSGDCVDGHIHAALWRPN